MNINLIPKIFIVLIHLMLTTLNGYSYSLNSNLILNRISKFDNKISHSDSIRIYVSFLVDVDGSIKDAKIQRIDSNNCDAKIIEQYAKETLDLVNKMPNWQIANSKGKPIKRRVVQPIVCPCNRVEEKK